MSSYEIFISQNVAVLVDGNNIERSLDGVYKTEGALINFDKLIPRILGDRSLNRLVYFREGHTISKKLGERLRGKYHGSVVPCHKSADVPLAIRAMQLANKVDCIIIMSGDSDYVDLVKHLKAEGVRVEICAVKRTTSKYLLEEAEYFHEVTRKDAFMLAGGKDNKRKAA